MVAQDLQTERTTLYALLGVGEDAGSEEITRAYRQQALVNHPDKGGDAALFDDLAKAFKTLDCRETREAYDDELARARERDSLVEGGPSRGGAAGGGAFSKQQAQAPMPREKTAPTAGSKRQGKLRTAQPGNVNMCAHEWKGMGSGGHVLKMLEDGMTDEQKTAALFDKYAALPSGKDKKRDWMKGVRGKDRQDLKALAKKKEAEQLERWNKWLGK
mmetsp:Transcript_96329/g.241513  ORF Transcript_96329/g.241513 Transcript_96329/m.241513 type:complete len:216 (+) Transcript_96329:98-745(+)